MSVSNSMMTHGGTFLFHYAKSTSCSLAADTMTRVSVSMEMPYADSNLNMVYVALCDPTLVLQQIIDYIF